MSAPAASAEDDPNLNPDVLRRRRDVLLSSLALLLVLGILLFAAYRLMRVPPPRNADLIAAAQQAVRENFPPGLTFQFSSVEETDVVRVDDDHYTVSGRFAAVTRSGLAEYYMFTCNLGRLQSAQWRPAKLALQRL